MVSTFEFLASFLRTRFSDSERGASLVEYALLVALIAVICVIAVTVLGETASGSFSSTASELGNTN
jgi:pilus assembly protein Flp/PilA